MTLENMELESGDIARNSHISANHANNDTTDPVQMEFVGRGEDIEEGEDLRKDSDIQDGTIHDETTSNIGEVSQKDNGHLRLHGDILTADPDSGNLRTSFDFLECMSIKSSPAEQTFDLLEEISEDLCRTDVFLTEGNDSGYVSMPENQKFDVCSRYRRARCSSCHDLCKAGHKHHLEDPTKRTILGTFKGGRPLLGTTNDLMSMSQAETKKTSLLRRSSLPGFIIEKDPQTHNNESMNPCKKDLNRLKLKRVPDVVKPPSGPVPGPSSSRIKTDVQAGGKNTVVRSPKLDGNSGQPLKEIKTKKEVGSCSRAIGKQKVKEAMSNPASPKTPLTPKRPHSAKTGVQKNVPSFPRSKNQSSPRDAKTKKAVNAPEKTLYMIEPSIDKKPVRRGLRVPSSSKSTEKAKEPMSNPGSPRTPKRSSTVKPRLINRNLKSSSSPKSQNKPEKAKITGAINVPEKTLYMIESASDKKLLRRTSTLASSNKSLFRTEPKSDKRLTRRASMSASSSKQLPNNHKGLEDDQNRTELDHLTPLSTSASASVVSIAEEPCQPLEDNQQIDVETADGGPGPSAPCSTESKSSETCHADQEDGPSLTLKPKRGTVVALEDGDTSPKKLQFRTGTILDDDQNDQDPATVNLKKNESTGDDDPIDAALETDKILLRRQEAIGRRNNLDLNNVIEETASMLVKTRKSKVKALVGAFETVISLHDRKPTVGSRAS